MKAGTASWLKHISGHCRESTLKPLTHVAHALISGAGVSRYRERRQPIIGQPVKAPRLFSDISLLLQLRIFFHDGRMMAGR